MADVLLDSIIPQQRPLVVLEEETPLGTAGTTTSLKFVGSGVEASRTGDVVTVSVPGEDADVAAAIAEHVAEEDAHPGYAKDAEVATAVSGAMLTHLEAADPHPQYVTDAEAAGIADSLIDVAIEAHLEATDPHPQYQTEADADLWLASKNFQSLIQFADDGAALGTSGTVNELDFVGVGVSATRVGNKITVAIDGTGDSEQVGIQFQDQGLDLGDDGTVDVIDFVGAGIEATRVGNRLTVNVSGSTASTMSGTYIASETMGGHRVVRSTGAGEVGYADSSTAGHGDDTVGITTSAVGIGENVEVLHNGYIYFIGWAWTVGQPIFLGTNGLLTQTPPSSGFVQVVGHAADTDTMFLSIETPIYY